MLLAELIDKLPIRVESGKTDVEIHGLAEDSRRVKPGDLFIARRGTATDGRQFIAQAVELGALAVIAHEPVKLTRTTALSTPDPAAVIVDLAKRFYADPAAGMKLIGITGTNGKTTTAFMVRHLLCAAGVRCGLLGTIELDDGRRARPAALTTPGAVELFAFLADARNNGCGACVMEVSSHALDQGRIRGLDFAVGVFTNLTGDHLDYHKTMDAYAQAKARLFRSLGPDATAVINADDPAAKTMIDGCRVRVLRFGSAVDVDCRVTIHASTSAKTECTFDGPWGALRVCLPLIGRHNAFNMGGALGALHALGIDVMALGTAVEACPPVPGRLERVPGGRGFEVFVDYAHTDDALENVLRALRSVTGGKLRVLFGCGGDRDATKRPRMARIACALADAVVVTSDNPRTEDPRTIINDILTGVDASKKNIVTVEPDRAAAIEAVIRSAAPGDTILIAGKGHEDYQIIGTQKTPFDDRAVALSVLESRAVREAVGVETQ